MKKYDRTELLQKDDNITDNLLSNPINNATRDIKIDIQTKLSSANSKNEETKDYGNKLGKSLTSLFIFVCIIVSFLFGIIAGKYITLYKIDNKSIDISTNDSVGDTDVLFTEINEKAYSVNAGDAIQLSCHSDNKNLNMKIEYVFNDDTTGKSLYSSTLSAGETLDFVPSDYFEGTHTISIIQNAYAVSDSVGVDILATHYSNVEITIME